MFTNSVLGSADSIRVNGFMAFTMLNVVFVEYYSKWSLSGGMGGGSTVKVFVCLSDELALSRVDKVTAAFISLISISQFRSLSNSLPSIIFAEQ